ncbi:hypothetical protein M501DRAFT_102953 [Patellaria atrata CBS 101060]|uniref:DUF8004 domain-containing protein n=1 Tax=Patellaria atrata CBS 101060 TaxID=1346257 RepID=A0A9P4VTV6_9PEZI|nr:hypothetical protein M501DRAFT_102953 [Patellaria atrata CBS 101060]
MNNITYRILNYTHQVPELWDENGDTYVYLFPKESGKGPSFRIDSATYAESLVLTKMAYGGIYSSNAASTAESRDASIDLITTNLDQDVPAPSRSPPPLPSKSPPPIGGSSSDGTQDSRTFSVESIQGPIHLYLRLKLSTDNAVPGGVEPKPNTQDADTLVGIRNLFAFLAGQSLVATENCPSVFNIFLRISDLLHSYGFSNIDGSTFGECAASSFDSYVDELQLGDMTKSREKTIEGIILGEKMRSVLLYNEAFVHGVGRYEDIQALNSPKWSIITPITRNRLERASLDLEVRLRNIHTKLSDFDFPSIFSGIMNSKEAEEGKLVHFEAWRNAFNAMRKFVLSYYKQQFGAWPPKATSKKNDLETSGLNRLVLKRLYHDFSDLYDLLVDRTSLTARTADGPLIDEAEATINLADLPYQQALVRALRSVLSEYDRATPPVQPPMPYDTPIFPPTSNQKTLVDKKKDAKQRSKKLNSDDLDRTLDASYNSDGITSNPFVAAFRDFERKINHNKSYDDIISNRMGQWLFLYAVLQSLPMVVVDAPAIKWTHGVEYFLCEPPRAGVPWAKEDTGVARSWYGIAGGSKVVSLPSDLVEHGVEGIYRRSHCWKMAEKWSGHGGILEAARHESIADALPAPPGMRLDSISSSRDTSPSRRNMESVMNLGLEQLPIPGQIAPSGSPALRPAPTHNDPTKTFDAILGLSEPVSHQKKKR